MSPCTDIKDDKNEKFSAACEDSGFISGSNFLESEESIKSENEKIDEEPEKVITKLVNDLDSCTLDIDFNKLSLKSERYSTNDNISTNSGDEPELWETYYTQDDDGDTLLHTAILEKDVPIAMELIKLAPHPCLLNIKNDECQTALFLAAFIRIPQLLRALIITGADPTLRNRQGDTPLHYACTIGDILCVAALTRQITREEYKLFGYRGKESVRRIPQNLELKNYNGYTCLHLAVINGHVEIVKYLVAIGADIENREMHSGLTALHLAVEHKQRKIIEVLVRECRAKLESINWSNLTPYQIAYNSDLQIARDLEHMGAEPTVLSCSESDESDLNSDYSDEDCDGIDTNEEKSDENRNIVGLTVV